MVDHEAQPLARADLVQAPAQALEPRPRLGVVGLARPEDDRSDLMHNVIVVGDDEHVADADREVNWRGRTESGARSLRRAAMPGGITNVSSREPVGRAAKAAHA